ncbi:hypothetical protein ZWY2020_000521 [Hordeum vulgare]|nr:hypothetical protein ZWY2020_000521 [Hordeum vulgare]
MRVVVLLLLVVFVAHVPPCFPSRTSLRDAKSAAPKMDTHRSISHRISGTKGRIGSTTPKPSSRPNFMVTTMSKCTSRSSFRQKQHATVLANNMLDKIIK